MDDTSREDRADRDLHFDCDFLIIGSGFGGSVSALRLAEKGYKVIVVERGRRWRAEDYPKTNWDIFNSVWLPQAGCTGILRVTLLSDVLALSGAGVGGGSLVYANTLLIPPRPFFIDPQWAEMEDWETTLAPHYRVAQRMLGSVPNTVLGPADDILRTVAEEMGVEESFKVTDVGVFLGEEDKTVPDPYFDGEGPERTGCVRCGACMTGCKFGGKNTLDKNYLYLAEKKGVEILADTEAIALSCVGGPEARGAQGWEVRLRPGTGVLRRLFGQRDLLRARQVVLSAGTLGTLPLLMRSRQLGLLPHLPLSLGDQLRTNSEAIVGASAHDDEINYSKGIAISSSAFFDEHTHIEVVRYGEGQDLLATISTLMADGGGKLPRILLWGAEIARHPTHFLRHLWPFGWSKRSIILLVMQTLDNRLRAVWRRSWLPPWRHTLKTQSPNKKANPNYIPIGNEVARRIAKHIGGHPVSALNEVTLDVPVTAHILGGCPIGPDPERGVIDGRHRVYNYEGLYVCDGSTMPANLGVNPSLTITALTERAMSLIPKKERGSSETSP